MTTATEIVEAVCDRMDVDVENFWHIRGSTTSRADNYGRLYGRRIMKARTVASWLMRVVLGMSFPEIAAVIGLAFHGDVMKLVKKLPENPELLNLSADLWFELEELMPLPVLKRKVAAVGLSLSY